MILTGVSRFFAAGYRHSAAAPEAKYSGGRVISDAGQYTISADVEVIGVYRKSTPWDHKTRFSGGQLTHSALEADEGIEDWLLGREPVEVMAGYLRVQRHGIGSSASPPFLGFGVIRRICDPDTVRLMYQPLILPKVKYVPQGSESGESEQGALNLTPTSYMAQIYPEDETGEWIWRFGVVETEEEAEAVIKGVFGMVEK